MSEACDVPVLVVGGGPASLTLVGLEDDDSGVTARIRDSVSGCTYLRRARFLVAADGGRTSSELLGITMLGVRSLVDVVTFYVEMDLSQYADDESLITYFVNPDARASVPGGLLALAPRPDARHSREWSISIRFPVGDPASEDIDTAMTRVWQMLGLPDIPIDIKAIGRWQYEGVVPDRFRVGSAFLVGDAAHRHPPTGGLGLNTAVHDAANLGWKLVAVLNGYADDGCWIPTSQSGWRLPPSTSNTRPGMRAAMHRSGGPWTYVRGRPRTRGGRRSLSGPADTPEGRLRQQAVREAVAHNREDYGQLNIEAGFAYVSGAVIDDGTPLPLNHGSATEYLPTARPGHERLSAIDLVALDGLSLLCTDPAWRAAAEAAAAATGCPVTLVCFGDHGPVADPGRPTGGAWSRREARFLSAPTSTWPGGL